MSDIERCWGCGAFVKAESERDEALAEVERLREIARRSHAGRANVERLHEQLAGAVSTVETHLHEPPRAPKGVRQADFRRGWEAARQAALIALGGAEREYPE
jgi:hypothetical protein